MPASKKSSKAPAKPAKAPAKPSVSNEQRIKTALKKLTGSKNTPAIFKLPSRRNTPVNFSLNEVRDLIKEKGKKAAPESVDATRANAAKKAAAQTAALQADQKPRVLKSATLDDLLGGGAKKNSKTVSYDEKNVPAKWLPYYKKLIILRDKLLSSVEERSGQTLKTSIKESSGDLSSYSISDGGTDAFDYDFALSLVSSDQEMLREVEAALQRIFNDTYGLCEVTGKPISRDRLAAVPFTRFSKEGQDQFEKTRRRTSQRIGISSTEDDDDATPADDEGEA